MVNSKGGLSLKMMRELKILCRESDPRERDNVWEVGEDCPLDPVGSSTTLPVYGDSWY